MSNEIAVVDDFERKLEKQKDLVKSLFCKDANKEEFEFFFLCCKRFKLDPFAKHIYFTKMSGKVTMITSIEGFRAIAERTGRYAPGSDTIFNYDKDGKLFSAKAFVKKMTDDGTWHEVSAIALWSEYGVDSRGASKKNVWGEKPHVMLEKCAEARALRRAFTMELSGLYGEGELDQAEVIQEEKKQHQIQAHAQEAVVLQEEKVFTKTLDECEVLAIKFWDMLRMYNKSLPSVCAYDLKYYLLYAQLISPAWPIESKFEAWAKNPATPKALHTWFESPNGKKFVASREDADQFHYEKAE